MPVTNYYTVDGQMIGYKTAAGRKDFLTDALGSVTAEVDQTGASKTFDGRYKPYGGDLSSTGARGSYGWVGTWGYRETGLSSSSHYVRARHYSKTSGNWTTADPLWPSEAGYGYVKAGTSISIDPSGLQSLPKGIWNTICPITKLNIGQCSTTTGGNCGPNQTGNFGKGRIDIGLYGRPGGGKTDINRCNPATVDKGALDRRIEVVKKWRDKMCAGSGSLPPGGGGYTPAVMTVPCKWLDSYGNFRLSCNIRCISLIPILNTFYKSGTEKNGIGCLACCLMVHESEHCNQILKGEPLGTYETECGGWSKELACLERVKEGKPCSA